MKIYIKTNDKIIYKKIKNSFKNNDVYLLTKEKFNSIDTSRSLIILDSKDSEIDHFFTESIYKEAFFLLLVNDDLDYLSKYNELTNIYYLKSPYDDLTLINKIKDILLIKEVSNDPYDIISRTKIIEALFNSSYTGFMISEIVDEREKLIYANQQFKKLFNYDFDINEPIYIDNYFKKENYHYHDYLNENNQESFTIKLNANSYIDNNRWYHITIVNISKKITDNKMSLYLVVDVSKEKENDSIISETKQTRDILTTSFPGVIYQSKNNGNWEYEYLSVGFYKLTGYKRSEVLKNYDAYSNIIVKKYRNKINEVISKACELKTSFSVEYQIKHKDGNNIWLLDNGACVYDELDNVVAVEGVIIDITDQKILEIQMSETLKRHYLTNLYNRPYLIDFLDEEKSNGNLNNSYIIKFRIVFYRDLIKYHGSSYVNSIITTIANYLLKDSNSNKIVFNSQSNHFLIYYRNAESLNYVKEDIKRITKELINHLSYEQLVFSSALMSLSEYQFESSDQLLNELLLTIEQNDVESGESLILSEFSPKITDENNFDRAIINQIDEIIKTNNKDNSFYLVAQPILNLKTNKISAVEVLARLKNDHYGNISPQHFIRLAEKNHLIDELGELIFLKSFELLNAFKKHGLNDIRVTINVSAGQTNRQDFPNKLKNLLIDNNVDGSKITLELTETVLVNNIDELNLLFKELKTFGVQTAIDDFGTGYSSLDTQTRFKVDMIKIDKSFINQIKEVFDTKCIIGDIISMTHRMERAVIAEGVEQQFHLDYLRKNNCDYAQGYYISKPLEKQDVIKFIKQYNK